MNLLKYAVLVAIIALPLELLSFAAGKFLARLALLYAPPAVADYDAYLRARDPLLGWPSEASLRQGEYDRSGSRIVPEFPSPAIPSCAALFGDSFTWGDEATAAQAYGNVLARLMRCRVANYGVPGYGTDQAYLRYLKVIHDPAPIVILGHFSDNVIRNVNQERGFLTNQAIGLKPRFILQGTELKLVPLPTLSEAEHRALDERGQELLPHEYFYPGGPSGIRSLRLPFTLSTLSAVRHYRVLARLAGRPSYAEFYDPQHPSGSLQVTEAIIKAFAAEASRRGQHLMVLFIPDEKDLRALQEHSPVPYAELARRIERAGIAVADAAPGLERSLVGRPPCALYTRCAAGHFTSEGYRLLAEVAYTGLRSAGWVAATAEH